MEYFGVTERSSPYLWASMISYNKKCSDFFEEWESILSNKYLLKEKNKNFPFREETALNVTFWKRKCKYHLGLFFFNTIKFENFLMVETEENFENECRDYDPLFTLDNSIYETCENSSIVQFYHGIKNDGELEKVLDWMKNNTI
jgi:hypothetical protein